MAKQKIRCAKGVRLTAEQRAKLEGFRAKEDALCERNNQVEEAYWVAHDKNIAAEEAYLAKQGLVYTTNDNYEEVVGRRTEEPED